MALPFLPSFGANSLKARNCWLLLTQSCRLHSRGRVDGVSDEAVLGHDGPDDPGDHRASVDAAPDLEGFTRTGTNLIYSGVFAA